MVRMPHEQILLSGHSLTGGFRYSCDICGKKYKYYSCFQEHRDLHAVDGKPCLTVGMRKETWSGRFWFICRSNKSVLFF